MGDAAKGAKIFKTKCAQCKWLFVSDVLGWVGWLQPLGIYS